MSIGQNNFNKGRSVITSRSFLGINSADPTAKIHKYQKKVGKCQLSFRSFICLFSGSITFPMLIKTLHAHPLKSKSKGPLLDLKTTQDFVIPSQSPKNPIHSCLKSIFQLSQFTKKHKSQSATESVI